MSKITVLLGQKDHRHFNLGQIKAVTIPPQTEEITVKSKEVVQEIYPSENKYISKVTVDPVALDKPDQTKITIPTKERQVIKADAGYELYQNIVEPIPDEYEIPVMYDGVTSVVPNKEVQQFETAGKKLDANLTVEPIPDEFADVSDTTATAGDVAVGKVFYDKDGVKTEGSGKLETKITGYGEVELPRDLSVLVTHSKDVLLYSTSINVMYVLDKENEILKSIQLPANATSNIFLSSDDMIIMTISGKNYIINIDSLSYTEISKPNTQTTTPQFEDSKGNIYFSNTGSNQYGIYKLNKITNTLLQITNSTGYSDFYYGNYYEDKNENVYVVNIDNRGAGTKPTAIYRIDNENNVLELVYGFESNSFVNYGCVAELDNTLYFAKKTYISYTATQELFIAYNKTTKECSVLVTGNLYLRPEYDYNYIVDNNKLYIVGYGMSTSQLYRFNDNQTYDIIFSDFNSNSSASTYIFQKVLTDVLLTSNTNDKNFGTYHVDTTNDVLVKISDQYNLDAHEIVGDKIVLYKKISDTQSPYVGYWIYDNVNQTTIQFPNSAGYRSSSPFIKYNAYYGIIYGQPNANKLYALNSDYTTTEIVIHGLSTSYYTMTSKNDILFYSKGTSSSLSNFMIVKLSSDGTVTRYDFTNGGYNVYEENNELYAVTIGIIGKVYKYDNGSDSWYILENHHEASDAQKLGNLKLGNTELNTVYSMNSLVFKDGKYNILARSYNMPLEKNGFVYTLSRVFNSNVAQSQYILYPKEI